MSERKSPLLQKGLAVDLWPIERPIPYARNPRQLPAAAIEKVAASIAEFGWRQPIVVDADGVIIAGHTRLAAARKLGLDAVPVHVAYDLSPAQAKALRLLDNRCHQEGSWDEELLSLELEDLAGLDIDLALTGFDEDELAHLMSSTTPGLTDPDEVPELPEEPVTKTGDLWVLGDHRLLCGDATKAQDVERLMDGTKAVLMATDPPYLVDYDGGHHPASEGNGGLKDGRKTGRNAEKEWDLYLDHAAAVDFYSDFLTLALQIALRPDAAIYECFGIMRSEVIWAAWRAVGLLPHQVLIWHKSRSVLTHSHFMWDYEPVMYGWPEGHRPKRKPPANEHAVWQIDSTEGNETSVGSVHPTIKPVELIRRPILFHTLPGELLYEPFSGSGTALIAAQQTGRRCYALELSPAFVDVAVERWQNFTGQSARRQ